MFLGEGRVPLKGFLFPLPPRDPNLWTVKCKVRALASGLGSQDGRDCLSGRLSVLVSWACQILGLPVYFFVLCMSAPASPLSLFPFSFTLYPLPPLLPSSLLPCLS